MHRIIIEYILNVYILLITQAAPGSRIVTVSSMAHKWGDVYFDDINWEKTEYNSSKAYGQSKLANILFSKELAKRLQGTGVTTYSLHPGVIATDLGRHIEDSLGKFSFVFRLELDNFDIDIHQFHNIIRRIRLLPEPSPCLTLEPIKTLC